MRISRKAIMLWENKLSLIVITGFYINDLWCMKGYFIFFLAAYAALF